MSICDPGRTNTAGVFAGIAGFPSVVFANSIGWKDCAGFCGCAVVRACCAARRLAELICIGRPSQIMVAKV
jgi:hypothetical protein